MTAHEGRRPSLPWDQGNRRAAVSRSIRLLAILFAATLVTPASRGEAQGAAPFDDGAHRGYLAVQLSPSGEPEVVAELNSDHLFVPASVLKIVTVAAALEHLGAGYQWVTRLTSNGVLDGEVLDGDLVIEPGADPTWSEAHFDGGSHEPLTALAGQVRARGVTRISGDLVIDASRFPGRPHPTDRSYGDLPYPHGTPAAALAGDEATISVRVAPGASVGDPATVRAPAGVEVINHTVTVGRERHGFGTLDFIPVWGTDTLLLRGEYPISEASFEVTASDPAPALRVARQLQVALAEAGVEVMGGIRQEMLSTGNREPSTLAELRSRPLGAVLERILTNSHNWYADMLTLTLALEEAGTGRFEDGVEVIADFAADPGGSPGLGEETPRVWIRDGSGLSSANLLTPQTVVRVVAYAFAQPWRQALIDALARPGTGTLAAWPPLPPVSAKTGTLRHTVALAGIFQGGVEAPVIFCYFVNHHPERPGQARAEIASAVRRWFN